VLVLRITKPNIDRPFKVPAIYLVAPLGALSAFGLMLGLPETTWTRLLVWMALGLAVYLTYSVRHSVVRHPPASRATRRRSPS
jgi:APA family basic amino acid/polyamine antiporter